MLKNVSRNQLVKLCRKYKLPISGSKKLLINLLMNNYGCQPSELLTEPRFDVTNKELELPEEGITFSGSDEAMERLQEYLDFEDVVAIHLPIDEER